MTLKELRQKISKSDNTELFQNISVTLNYNHLNKPIKLEGVISIYKYIKSQKEIWDKKDNLPGALQNSRNHFNQLLNQFESFINSNLSTDGNDFKRNWSALQRNIQNPNTLKGSEPVLTADSPIADFLLEVHSDFPNSYGNAYQHLVRNNVGNLNNPAQITGALLAYEFDLQDHTEIQQRRNNEKISLGLIRNKIEERLSETESSAQAIINETEKEFQEYVKAIDELKESKDKNFEQWFGKSKQDFTSFYEGAKKDAENLREVYRERLRFAGPVTYWKKRALEMKRDGGFWIKWLTASVILAAGSIFALLWLVPDSMTFSLFNGNPIAIKWTLLFVTFISFLAYGARTFAKLTFSSYHLARDAEEREQLTHIYLALKKDADVEEQDRTLILQALFSRAETGLLKDDSAPTMPATVLEKIKSI